MTLKNGKVKSTVNEAELDVIVILEKDGVIVNGNGGVLKGQKSELGMGMLGYMTLDNR